MPHWSDIYPHNLYASVCLLDGKIEQWKVGNYPKRGPMDFSGYWKMNRLDDYTAETKEFVCNNQEEHSQVFQTLAQEWFKQWQVADDFQGSSPHVHEMF